MITVWLCLKEMIWTLEATELRWLCVFAMCGCETWERGCFLCGVRTIWKPGGGQIPFLPHFCPTGGIRAGSEDSGYRCQPHTGCALLPLSPKSGGVYPRFIRCFFFWLWCMACGILVPSLGIKPQLQQWKHQVLTNEPPGNSQPWIWFI